MADYAIPGVGNGIQDYDANDASGYILGQAVATPASGNVPRRVWIARMAAPTDVPSSNSSQWSLWVSDGTGAGSDSWNDLTDRPFTGVNLVNPDLSANPPIGANFGGLRVIDRTMDGVDNPLLEVDTDNLPLEGFGNVVGTFGTANDYPAGTALVRDTTVASDLTQDTINRFGGGWRPTGVVTDSDVNLNADNEVTSINVGGTNRTISGGGDLPNVFTTFQVPGGNSLSSETAQGTLTFAAGENVTITGNDGNDTITIASTASGGGGTTLSHDELTTINVMEQNVINTVNIESTEADPIAPRFLLRHGSTLADYQIDDIANANIPTNTRAILFVIFHDGVTEGTPPTIDTDLLYNIEIDRDAHDGVSEEIDISVLGSQIITGHRFLGTYSPDTGVASSANNTWIIPFADTTADPAAPANYTLNSGAGSTLLDSINLGTTGNINIFGLDTTNSREVIFFHTETTNKVFPHFDDSNTPLDPTVGLENLIARDDPDIPNDTGMQADIGYESANNQIDIVFAANTPTIDIGTVLVQQQAGEDDLTLHWTITRRSGNRYYGQASDAYAAAIENQEFGFRNYASDGNNRFYRISSLDGPNQFQPTVNTNFNAKFTGYHRQQNGGILGTRLPDGKVELTFTQNPILTTASPNIPFIQPSDVDATILFSSNIELRTDGSGVDNIGGDRIEINARTRTGFIFVPRHIPDDFGTTAISTGIGNPTADQINGLINAGGSSFIEFPLQIDQGSNIIRRSWHRVLVTGIEGGTFVDDSTPTTAADESGAMDLRIRFSQVDDALINEITHSNQWHNTVVAGSDGRNIWTLNQQGRGGVRTGFTDDMGAQQLPEDSVFINNGFERDSFTNFTRFRVVTGTPLLTGRLNVSYNATTGHVDGTIVAASDTEPTTTFRGLTDTPDTFSGQAGQFLRVNTGATALEFTDAPGGGISSGDAFPTSPVPTAGTVFNLTGATLPAPGGNFRGYRTPQLLTPVTWTVSSGTPTYVPARFFFNGVEYTVTVGGVAGTNPFIGGTRYRFTLSSTPTVPPADIDINTRLDRRFIENLFVDGQTIRVGSATGTEATLESTNFPGNSATGNFSGAIVTTSNDVDAVLITTSTSDLGFSTGQTIYIATGGNVTQTIEEPGIYTLGSNNTWFK